VIRWLLNDVFCELLRYTRAVDNPKRYTISREKHVQANGKFADAVLGEFASEGKRYVAAVEGKGPKDPLDRPFAGGKVPAVDQAYDYAINLRCNSGVADTILTYRPQLGMVSPEPQLDPETRQVLTEVGRKIPEWWRADRFSREQ